MGPGTTRNNGPGIGRTYGILGEMDKRRRRGTLFVLEVDPPSPDPRWYCHLDGDRAPGFDSPEEAVVWGLARARGVVVRTLRSRFYLAGRQPADWGRGLDLRPWPPAADERRAIDDEYAAAVADATREEATWRHYECARDAWIELHAPELVGDAPLHECSIALPDATDHEIQFEEFDISGTLCGACAKDGTYAFGDPAVVIATASRRPRDDRWVGAVVDAVARERSWYSENRRDRIEVTFGRSELFHLSASANRDSILQHGLDWRRMGASGGIAGSRSAELPAIFLCDGRFDVDFFLRMARWPCDLWVVGVDGLWIENGPSGWLVVPEAIAADRVRLAETDVPPLRP